EALVSAWKPGSVLFYTAVEPPIFKDDKHDWKVVRNFGDDLETFDLNSFRLFTKQRILDETLRPFVTNDPFFFLCVERQWLLDMGGLDPLFNPMFCEDSDLLLRFKLQNAYMVQVPKAMAYHFVSKT